MGWRFQRSVRILPGLRVNLSKGGVGFSTGVRGLRAGVDSRGRKYASAGIPGTGLSWRQYSSKKPSRASSVAIVLLAGILGIAALVLLVVLANMDA